MKNESKSSLPKNLEIVGVIYVIKWAIVRNANWANFPTSSLFLSCSLFSPLIISTCGDSTAGLFGDVGKLAR